MVKPLILPGMAEYYETLENPDMFDWRAFANAKSSSVFVIRADTNLLECVTNDELNEYIYGGEYEERLKLIVDPG